MKSPATSRPKIDLHLHLDGAVRTQTILELAQRAHVPLPANTVEELEKHVTVGPDCRSLLDFLTRFDVFLPVLRSAHAMERVAFELAQDQRADNVVYFEARYAPLLQTPDISLDESVEAVIAGLARGAPDQRWGVILCALRNVPQQTSDTVSAAMKYFGRGVVGIDIAGDERAPAAAHADAFAIASTVMGIPITVHAGEAGPAANIREAIDVLHARRIGHGIRVVDDPALLRECIERGIAFENCLTSNLQTRSVPSLDAHPFPRLLREGALVTLNTDDPGVSRITLSGEHELAERTFGPLDWGVLWRNSVEASFADEATKRWLRGLP